MGLWRAAKTMAPVAGARNAVPPKMKKMENISEKMDHFEDLCPPSLDPAPYLSEISAGNGARKTFGCNGPLWRRIIIRIPY